MKAPASRHSDRIRPLDALRAIRALIRNPDDTALVFEIIEAPARGKKCDAMDGILDEGKEIMDEYKGSPAIDAGLLAAAQAVEHYEISRYGTLKAWAEKLGLDQAAKLLDQTLQEEKRTDADLTKIAEDAINVEAEAA